MTKEIDLFMAHLETEDLATGTISGYRANLALFAEWLNGRSIAQVSPIDIKRYKSELKVTYKPSTINRKLAHLSAFFKWCSKTGLIEQSPVKVKWVSYDHSPKWLNQEKVDALLNATSQAETTAREKGLCFTEVIAKRTRSIVMVLLNTGLRVSELCDLKLSDINEDVLTVRWGKGSKRREIPINDQAKEAIKAWLEVRQSDSPYFFVTDGRMTRQLVEWHLSELGNKIGFKLSPHMLRHTFGKRLVDRGVSLDRIAKLMGHSNINTTMIYTMPGIDDLRQAVKSLD